ncbi:MAG: aminotransferase class V-fold PLP-dependent enzyme [Candidatus Eremiobacteraeota bacterium]|nr:aminotransferase class V-fold PLP-dependent enzyme [Candidatus Eremiobacteraeota bacterium]MBC5827521.1 aminotransferase class V-fold PLP-dependent enzyme [Candidatus Eremiobacteraeota bacterium]
MEVLSQTSTAVTAPPLDRALFPIVRHWSYCDHAAVGPLPRPTRDAMIAALDAQMIDGCSGILRMEERKTDVRSRVAAAIKAQPEEIAFMRSTSDGALLVANGLDWRTGDEVIASDNEFGANAYPWLNLRDRGVRVRLIRTPHERLSPQVLDRLYGPHTRLVAVSYVSFCDGFRHDVAAIGRWCRERGILLAVDAIQGFGALPLDVVSGNIDFCYFGTAKWLLSPQGLSVVFVRRDHIERLRPTTFSWRSVRAPMDFLDYAQELNPTAERFEGATINHPGLAAFGMSLDMLTHAGLGAIERHVLKLTDRLIRSADAAGIPVLSDRSVDARSGIVLLGAKGADSDSLAARARERHVGITVRDSGVRVSPHGYNNEDDVDAVISLLAEGGP